VPAARLREAYGLGGDSYLAGIELLWLLSVDSMPSTAAQVRRCAPAWWRWWTEWRIGQRIAPVLNYKSDLLGSQERVIVRPKAQCYPALESEEFNRFTITGLVRNYLLTPVFRVRGWHPIVLWTSVPEAAVHKDGDFDPREHQVGGTAHVAEWPLGDPVSQT
jgi:hypothetical protein